MCKYHNMYVRLLKLSNLCIEPGNVPLMRFVVRVDIPDKGGFNQINKPNKKKRKKEGKS